MTAQAFPVATQAADLLSCLPSQMNATRESEAARLAGSSVAFVSEVTGPAFESRETAHSYFSMVYPDLLAKAYALLQCRIKPTAKRSKQARLSGADGQRWAKMTTQPMSEWRLSLTYWKILPLALRSDNVRKSKDQARRLRRKDGAQALTTAELMALSQSPLMAYRPQKALDIGLFEVRPPENPGILIADE
jgi:hypothetical protein